MSSTGCRCAAGDLPVELLGEGLQVHVGGVDVLVEVPARLVADVAGGHGDRADADRPAGLGDVDRVLEEDRRIVVGEGDAAAAELLARRARSAPARPASASFAISRDLLMSQFWQNLQERLQPSVPNDRTGDPGQEMIERLLLDRVDAEAARAAVGRQHDLAALAARARSRAPAALPAECRTAGRRRTGPGRPSRRCQYRVGTVGPRRAMNVCLSNSMLPRGARRGMIRLHHFRPG